MGFTDFFKKLVPLVGQEKKEQEKAKDNGEECALCKKTNTDKKWMGQSWHKECLRKAKKMAKKMI